jgi:hypothetical protein
MLSLLLVKTPSKLTELRRTGICLWFEFVPVVLGPYSCGGLFWGWFIIEVGSILSSCVIYLII